MFCYKEFSILFARALRKLSPIARLSLIHAYTNVAHIPHRLVTSFFLALASVMFLIFSQCYTQLPEIQRTPLQFSELRHLRIQICEQSAPLQADEFGFHRVPCLPYLSCCLGACLKINVLDSHIVDYHIYGAREVSRCKSLSSQAHIYALELPSHVEQKCRNLQSMCFQSNSSNHLAHSYQLSTRSEIRQTHAACVDSCDYSGYNTDRLRVSTLSRHISDKLPVSWLVPQHILALWTNLRFLRSSQNPFVVAPQTFACGNDNRFHGGLAYRNV